MDEKELELWEKEGFEPEEAEKWSGAGFSLKDAVNWSETILKPEEAKKWFDERVEPEDADAWSYYKFTPKVAKKLIAAGFDGFDAQSLNTRGITSKEAEKWCDNGFNINQIEDWHDETGFGPDKAKAWAHEGFSPKNAKEWDEEEFEPKEARKWDKICDPSEAKEWIAKEIDFEEANKWVEVRATPEEANEWITKGFYFEDMKAWQLNGLLDPEDIKEWQGMNLGLEDAEEFYKEADEPVFGIEIDEVKEYIKFKFNMKEAGQFTKKEMSPEKAFGYWSKGFTDFELIKKGRKFKKDTNGKYSTSLFRALLPGWKHINEKLKAKWGITLDANIINNLRDKQKACQLKPTDDNKSKKGKVCKLDSVDYGTLKKIMVNYKKAYKKYLNGKKIPETSYKFKDPEKPSNKGNKLDTSKIKKNLERSAASMAYFLDHVDMEWNYVPD